MPETWTKADWRALCPDLTIGEKIETPEIAFDVRTLEETAAHFWREGYLVLPSILPEDALLPIRSAMERLDQQGVPPVFIYLYDQPFALFGRLNALIRHFLGSNFAVLPNLWAWRLAKEGARGWPPHRDCTAETVFDIGGDKILMSLSLWLSLSDVDEANGCMYVLPRRQEAHLKSAEPSVEQLLAAGARALPCPAGAILGWPQDLYHWGGTYGADAKGPRLSLSLEFQNCSFDPLAEPLLDLAALPDFEARRQLIVRQFDKYRHIDPVLSSRL